MNTIDRLAGSNTEIRETLETLRSLQIDARSLSSLARAENLKDTLNSLVRDIANMGEAFDENKIRFAIAKLSIILGEIDTHNTNVNAFDDYVAQLEPVDEETVSDDDEEGIETSV